MSIRPPLISLIISQYCSKKWFSAAPQECCILSLYTSSVGDGDGLGDGDGDGDGDGVGDGVGDGDGDGVREGAAQAAIRDKLASTTTKKVLPNSVNNLFLST